MKYFRNQAPRLVGSSLAQRGPLAMLAVNSRFASVAQEILTGSLVLGMVGWGVL